MYANDTAHTNKDRRAKCLNKHQKMGKNNSSITNI